MSAAAPAGRVLLAGTAGRFSAALAARLRGDGHDLVVAAELTGPAVEAALAGGSDLDAMVIDAVGAVGGAGFLTLSDAAFVGRLEDFLDLFEVLQAGLARLRAGGAVVALISRGYLGAWGGADEMAFSGAVAGLMRSIALEDTPPGLRANVVACDFAPEAFGGDRREPPDQGERVAGAVAFFLGPDARAITGEILLANSGRGLLRREARDRRDQLAGRESPPPPPPHQRSLQR